MNGLVIRSDYSLDHQLANEMVKLLAMCSDYGSENLMANDWEIHSDCKSESQLANGMVIELGPRLDYE